jgi:hypothetical protein
MWVVLLSIDYYFTRGGFCALIGVLANLFCIWVFSKKISRISISLEIPL